MYIFFMKMKLKADKTPAAGIKKEKSHIFFLRLAFGNGNGKKYHSFLLEGVKNMGQVELVYHRVMN